MYSRMKSNVKKKNFPLLSLFVLFSNLYSIPTSQVPFSPSPVCTTSIEVSQVFEMTEYWIKLSFVTYC